MFHVEYRGPAWYRTNRESFVVNHCGPRAKEVGAVEKNNGGFQGNWSGLPIGRQVGAAKNDESPGNGAERRAPRSNPLEEGGHRKVVRLANICYINLAGKTVDPPGRSTFLFAPRI